MLSSQNAVAIEETQGRSQDLAVIENNTEHIAQRFRQHLVVNHVRCDNPIDGRGQGANGVNRVLFKQIQLAELYFVSTNLIVCRVFLFSIKQSIPTRARARTSSK